jgi:hypothetical protein
VRAQEAVSLVANGPNATLEGRRAANHPLAHLIGGMSASKLEPGKLGLLRGHPGDLTHLCITDFATLKRTAQIWKLLQHSHDAKQVAGFRGLEAQAHDGKCNRASKSCRLVGPSALDGEQPGT